MANDFKKIRSQFYNLPIKNSTQTMFTRFLRSPKANLGTDFEASREDFNKQIKDINKPIKTAFSTWEEF